MGGPSKKQMAGGLRIDTKGLNLAGNVFECNQGMSPLMERFNKNKQSKDNIDGAIQSYIN